MLLEFHSTGNTSIIHVDSTDVAAAIVVDVADYESPHCLTVPEVTHFAGTIAITSGAVSSGVHHMWNRGGIVNPPQGKEISVCAELGDGLRNHLQNQLRFVSSRRPKQGCEGEELCRLVNHSVLGVAGQFVDDRDDVAVGLRAARNHVAVLKIRLATGTVEPRFQNMKLLAETVLKHLEESNSENLDAWANRLASDLSNAAD